MAFRRDALVAIGGFNPALPAGRRRRGHLLAAAGARPRDRVRAVGARLASPSLVGEGLLAAAGRLRRRRDVARRAPPREVRARPDALARPHLQPAAVPQALSPDAGSTPGSGARPRSRRSTARTPTALEYLPHSPAWMLVSLALVVAGFAGPRDRNSGCPAPAPRHHRVGRHAGPLFPVRVASDLRGLPQVRRPQRFQSRLVYRALIAWMHLINPIARMWGRIKGMSSMPQAAAPSTSRGVRGKRRAGAR